MDQPKSYKPLWWALTAVAALILVAMVWSATRRSDRAVEQSAAAGTTTGLAYDPTTGNTVAAGATPGALGTGGPPPIIEPRGNSANGSAGGTIAGVNPQFQAAPGPAASGTLTPPAKLDR